MLVCSLDRVAYQQSLCDSPSLPRMACVQVQILMYAVVSCCFGLPGIREYVSAQRVNSSVTIVKRLSMEFMGNHFQRCNTAESFVTSTPFLNTEELDEFHDATMDQFSECSEVRLLTKTHHCDSSYASIYKFLPHS